tara:strand:+ start:577 stop:1254 length:678 start_codon:yes stop_codon:yes gene_type:complete
MRIKKNLLIIAPHLDDETIGCAGSLLKLRKEGYNLFYVLVTFPKEKDGYSKYEINERNRWLKKISSIYKFKKIFLMNYSPALLKKNNTKELISKFRKILISNKINIILTPFNYDAHTDHKIISNAVLSSAKSFRIKSLLKLMMYETLSETNFNYDEKNQFIPNQFINITDFIKKKIEICKIFKSEFNKHPFPRSFKSIKALATLRGSESGFKAAESFKVVFEKFK